MSPTRRRLMIQPVAILLALGAWVLWRGTATLDSIESRQLAWSELNTLAVQHLEVTAVAAAAVLVVAIPLGIVLTRPRFRRASTAVVGVANAGQAAPAIGLIVLLAMWVGFGFQTAVIALALYGILPVLQNTIVGLNQVDRTLVEAGRGMGMSSLAVLFKVELPLAVPVMAAGIRTALVLLVGTATLATFINAGGLGSLIVTGITLFRYPILVSGAILVALLALAVDWAGHVIEEIVRPKGLSS